MVKKTGRNDPCPCGSGNKFKNCCLEKTKEVGRIPWRTFPEDFVIGELLKSSKEFQAFYEAERKKILQPIHWAEDQSLPEGIDYRVTRNQAGTQVIRLRHVPSRLGDASKIAHELGHLVLHSEGFPDTGADARFETVSSALNSMVHDPLVDSRLQPYGFDLRADYVREVEETFRQLESLPDPPSDHPGKMHWVFNYVGKVLDWELVSDEDDGASSEFELWFDARYPEVGKDAKDLLALVKSFGYETPGKMAELFKEIIQRYELRDIVFLAFDGPR